jgi:hypothetical protein
VSAPSGPDSLVMWGLLAAALFVRACHALALRFGPGVRRRLVPAGNQVASPFESLLSFWTTSLSVLLGFVVLAAGLLAGSAGDHAALLAVPPSLFVLFPWAVLRWVLVPLGGVKAAYYLGWMCEWAFRQDGAGGPVFAAAWALARSRDAGEATVAWVEERLAAVQPLQGAGVVAAGLLAARRGDREGARALLESALDLSSVPLVAERVAREFLAGLRAEEGRWAELCGGEAPAGWWARAGALMSRVLGRSRATLLIEACARRLLHRDDAPGDGALWLLWLLAPGRLGTRSLMKRALAAARGAVPDGSSFLRADVAAEPAAGAPLPEAIAMQVRLWAVPPGGALTLDDLSTLGAAWDRALADAALEQQVLVRSLELGAAEGSQVRPRLADEAASELARLARARELPIGAAERRGPTLDRAARKVRDELLGPVEAASAAMRRRAIEKRALPPLDEWREYLSLRERYELCARVGGAEGRRLAWPRVRDDVCKLAVWLWNIRSEKAIANAMFAWLLAEATALGDEPTIELQKKNVDCGG